ncbi:MAG: hypothetical protein DRO06_00405, partial [Thermoproteota archaeon]
FSGDRTTRARLREIARLGCFRDVIVDTLRAVVRSFPSIDDLHPFYRDLADLVVGVDELKHSLGAVDWAAGKVDDVVREAIRSIRRASSFSKMERLRRAAMGRASSILRRVEGEIEALSRACVELRRLPSLDPGLPSVVVAGSPNTGKSTIVRSISSGRPEVAPYPFTTKGVLIGHSYLGALGRIQVVDTPGLLDRPLSERNEIELQAVLALKHLADVILFVSDPTETCGYPLESQLRILREVREEFSRVPLIVVANKSDMGSLFRRNLPRVIEVAEAIEAPLVVTSAIRGWGLPELLSVLEEVAGGGR